MKPAFHHLRDAVEKAATGLDADGSHLTARYLRVALARFEEQLTGRGLFEAIYPDEPRLFEELGEHDRDRYEEIAARIRGDVRPAAPVDLTLAPGRPVYP